MQYVTRLFQTAVIAYVFLLLASTGAIVQAQERMMIQATARGTSTQIGRSFNVNIHINEFSTLEDRKALIDAFARSGQDGLVHALEDMKEKGRISTPWGVGNGIAYIFELPPTEKGRHIRLVTNRRITMGEAFNQPRSEQYDVGAVELILTPDGKSSSGTLLPACKLKVDKKTQQIEIETFQNPWNLINLMVSTR